MMGKTNVTPASVTIFTVAIGLAEIIMVAGNVVLGILLHSMLVLGLLLFYSLEAQIRPRSIIIVLLLLPLMRILSVTMPISDLPQILWYAMIGIPLLLAAFLSKHYVRLSWADLGLRSGPFLPQAIIALCGLPLSVIAYVILRPEAIVDNADWWQVAASVAILLIFTGFVEEFIFRGLLQQTGKPIFGDLTKFYISIIFAMMYLGTLSAPYIVFMALVGVFFSECVERTGSLWGVILAHGILNIGLIVIWP